MALAMSCYSTSACVGHSTVAPLGGTVMCHAVNRHLLGDSDNVHTAAALFDAALAWQLHRFVTAPGWRHSKDNLGPLQVGRQPVEVHDAAGEQHRAQRYHGQEGEYAVNAIAEADELVLGYQERPCDETQ